MSFEIVRVWGLLAATLFFSTLLHEDAAILAGGYLVVENHLPAALAGGSLFGGVVLGDCAIYGLGRLARRSERLKRWLPATLSAGTADGPSWLSRRLYWVVAGCRLTPTMLFPTFAAIGFSKVPFRRFALAVLLSATLYVPTLFVAVVYFGDALVDRLKMWGWPVMGMAVLGLWLLRRQSTKRHQAAESDPLASRSGLLSVHHGMPALDPRDVRVPLSERIPAPLYYVPLVLQWFWLAARFRSLTLPTVANPSIEAGGLLGESKIACMDLIGPACSHWAARSAAIDTSPDIAATARTLEDAMTRAGIAYPMMVKPDIGWRGIGVRRLNGPADIEPYLAGYPLGSRLMVQEFVDYDGEAGVFYARMPGEEAGGIFSLTFRYYPFVVGDGRSTLRQLILANERTRWKAELHLAAHAAKLDEVLAENECLRLAMVGSNRVGGLYIDGRPWITAAMTARFDEIAKSMPEFWFGRFDVRFKSIEALQAGEDFLILEANGAGSEAIHMWDPNFPLLEGYRTLFAQQSLMFAIGDANRRRGFQPLTPFELISYQRRQQKLLGIYPESN
ncbi:MAG TPA: VTT domain-containing protein [Candidatus Sulfotelmatobacter sp.]|nr:VTT domain-containing protein [Candidatus Sulfotelmatobacter sp.]